jgi:hypothetical protein
LSSAPHSVAPTKAFIAAPVHDQRLWLTTRCGLVGRGEYGPHTLFELGAQRGVGRALGLGDVEVEPARDVDPTELERHVGEVAGMGGEERRRRVADEGAGRALALGVERPARRAPHSPF